MFGRRLNVFYALICAGLLALVGKLVYLQAFQMTFEDPDRVLHPPAPWRKIPAWRGPVCDRNGDILEGDRPFLDIAVDYRALKYPKYWLKPILQATGRDERELLAARRDYAYGPQHDWLDDRHVIGWTREGVAEKPGSGLAVLLSDGPGGSKWMYVGHWHAGKRFRDCLGHRPESVVVNEHGWAQFHVNGGSVSVWTPVP